jgi:hypothetical protein
MAIKNTKLGGACVEGIPLPGEKSNLNKGNKIEGTPSAGVTKANPLAASYDSRPLSGDNKPGATRAKGSSGPTSSRGDGGKKSTSY